MSLLPQPTSRARFHRESLRTVRATVARRCSFVEEVAAVGPGQLPGDAKPSPEPPQSSRLTKRWNTFSSAPTGSPGPSDPHLDAAIGQQRHGNPNSGGGVTARVVQQVGEHLEPPPRRALGGPLAAARRAARYPDGERRSRSGRLPRCTAPSGGRVRGRAPRPRQCGRSATAIR